MQEFIKLKCTAHRKRCSFHEFVHEFNRPVPIFLLLLLSLYSALSFELDRDRLNCNCVAAV